MDWESPVGAVASVSFIGAFRFQAENSTCRRQVSKVAQCILRPRLEKRGIPSILEGRFSPTLLFAWLCLCRNPPPNSTNKTCQGYLLKHTLKLAGYSFWPAQSSRVPAIPTTIDNMTAELFSMRLVRHEKDWLS